jgi:hypothetical protein
MKERKRKKDVKQRDRKKEREIRKWVEKVRNRKRKENIEIATSSMILWLHDVCLQNNLPKTFNTATLRL